MQAPTLTAQVSEWLLLRAIDLVTGGVPLTPVPHKEFDLKDLDGHIWELHRASHWPHNDQAPIGLEENYRGLTLVCHDLKTVILVHRGLQLTSAENLADGFSIAVRKIPKIVEPALLLSKIAYEYADSQNYELLHTGFSLGGFLAQITGAHCHHERQRHNKVICFDAAGAKKTIKAKGFSDNRANTINYVTAPNLVNTITPHYGVVRQICAFQEMNLYLMPELKPVVSDKAVSIDSRFPEQASFDAMRMLIMGTMLKSHNQSDMRDTLSNNASFVFKKVRSWPVSSLSFENSDHKKDDTPSAPLQDDWLGVTTMILSLAKEILTRCGYEDHIVLQYQLSNAAVHHHQDEDQESFCHSTHKIDLSTVKTLFSPPKLRPETHNEREDEATMVNFSPSLGMSSESDVE